MKSTSKMFKALFGGVILLLVFALVGQAAAQTWTELSPTGGPPGVRTIHSAVFNSTNNRMIVFGGLNADGVAHSGPLFNDVWVLENADGLGGPPTWMQLSPTGGPPSARGYHSAVYDAANNRMMVFAGDPNVGSCGGAVNDVWVLTNADGTGGTPNWSQLSPTGGPPNLRQGPTAVYDAATNRMIVFGGNPNACIAFSNDVWVLQNANGLGGSPTWTQLFPAGAPPPARAGHTAVYDAANNRMIVFGGQIATGNDVWVLENANGVGTPTWTQLSPTGGPPAIRFSHSAVYDSANNRMMVFGGCCTSGRLNDVWVLANANGLGGTPNWVELSPTGVLPSLRDTHTAVYSPATNRMVVFAGRSCSGGCTGPEFFALNDVWVLADANGIFSVPFAAFDAKVEIELGPLVNDDAFEVKAIFTLGAGSNGIDPLTEDVSFQVGTFSTTIPAGSFHFKPAKPGKHGKPGKPARFTFEGVINGVAVEVKITPLGANSFEFKTEGQGADLTGTANPVTLGLTIGDDGGSVMVTAEFE